MTENFDRNNLRAMFANGTNSSFLGHHLGLGRYIVSEGQILDVADDVFLCDR